MCMFLDDNGGIALSDYYRAPLQPHWTIDCRFNPPLYMIFPLAGELPGNPYKVVPHPD